MRASFYLSEISNKPSIREWTEINFVQMFIRVIHNSFFCTQGYREGGQAGTMTSGPMDFRGPTRGPMGFRRAHSNDAMKSACETGWPFFFFGDHLISVGKTVRISVKTFSKRHFLRLFWSSDNRKSVIFELAPGTRSALGAPVCTRTCIIQITVLKESGS